jgi:hypothetical protein
VPLRLVWSHETRFLGLELDAPIHPRLESHVLLFFVLRRLQIGRSGKSIGRIPPPAEYILVRASLIDTIKVVESFLPHSSIQALSSFGLINDVRSSPGPLEVRGVI